MKVKLIELRSLRGYSSWVTVERSNSPPISPIDDLAELERTRWYPKDGELCLGKTKPEETLVEVCSDSDVQIDRQTWV
jgi:hypothetical protein